MIQVTVRLYATLRRFAPAGLPAGASFAVSLAPGSTLADLVRQLRLPPEETKQFFVLSRQRDMDFVLHDGDDLAIFPPVGGG